MKKTSMDLPQDNQGKPGMIELNLDDMDKITGGVMTSGEKSTLSYYLKMAKDANLTMDQVLAFVPQFFPVYSPKYPNVTMQDVTDYIKNVYPTL